MFAARNEHALDATADSAPPKSETPLDEIGPLSSQKRNNWLPSAMSVNGMVRPCSCPARDCWQGGMEDKEHVMSHTAQSAITVIGIDIGKNSFHWHDDRGGIVLRQKWSRGQVDSRPLLSGFHSLRFEDR
jgi:hypothetical protein